MISTADIQKRLSQVHNLRASKVSTSNANNYVVSCKSSELLQNLVGKIQPGTAVEFCTAGEFSMHQLLQYLLTETGNANVYISTWTLKEEPARVLHFLKQTGKIKALYCVMDYRIRTMDAKHFDFIAKSMDAYMLTKCHAKVMVIEGERMSVTVVSSANFSNNPRIEAGVISCNEISASFHKGWIMDVIGGKKVC